jgi:hypothetical protein
VSKHDKAATSDERRVCAHQTLKQTAGLDAQARDLKAADRTHLQRTGQQHRQARVSGTAACDTKAEDNVSA